MFDRIRYLEKQLAEADQRAEDAEDESAEIAGKLVDAVKAMKTLAEIVEAELGELEGGREPDDLAHWRSALAKAEAVIEKAKPQDARATCPCGDEFLLDKRPWAVIYSKCKPLCPDCAEKLRETMEI